MDRLLDCLTNESLHYSTDPRFRDAEVDTVFFGGGTPSLLSAIQFQRLIGYLFERFNIDNNAEVTVEVNPDDVTNDLIGAFRDSRVNRISLGAQSFDDTELAILNRRHNSETTRNAVNIIKNEGLSNYSLDLIYGVPGHTMDSWSRTLESALELNPKHFSAYCLTVEKGTPLHRSIQLGEIVLPPDEVMREMYIEAVERLSHAGYAQYELSNFAIAGFESRHNLAYWTGKPYLGLGPSSSSYFHLERWKNVADINGYIESVNKTGSGVSEMEVLDDDMQRSEYVMLSLRMPRGLNLSDYMQRFGRDLLAERSREIESYSAEGLLIRDDDCIRLTPSGMFVSDDIISVLV